MHQTVLSLNRQLLDDEAKFKSLMERRRRYQSLRVEGVEGNKGIKQTKLTELQQERLLEIIKRFGFDIKFLYMKSLILNEIFVQLLNLLPSIKTICLPEVSYQERETNDNLLNLHKLEQINWWASSKRDLSTLEVFETLPAGVLRKVTINNCSPDPEEVLSNEVKLFPNQHNLEHLIIQGYFNITNLDFDNFQLKSLWWDQKESNEIQQMIKGQHKLTRLKLGGGLKNGELKAICRELPSLEKLKLTDANEFDVSEFVELSKLKNLKLLNLSFTYENFVQEKSEHFNERMIILESDSLVKLELRNTPGFTQNTLIQLFAQLPSLQKLTVNQNSEPLNTEMDAILRQFEILSKEQTSHLICCFSYKLFSGLKMILQYGFHEKDFHGCPNSFRDKNVTTLDLTCKSLSASNLAKLGANFPLLKNLFLKLNESEESELDVLIQHFPRLQNLFYKSSITHFTYQDGSENECLKDLSVHADNFNEDFVRIIGVCRKLEKLKVDGLDNPELIQKLLILQPNLKCLTWNSTVTAVNEEIIRIIKDHGENLNYFHFQLAAIKSPDALSSWRDDIKKELAGQFELIILENSYESYEVENKRGLLMWKMRRI